MQTERRSAPRQGLNSLVYLDIEPDNGGILLNLSEDGMQISVANRLVTSSEIHFTLRLEPNGAISGTGRVAWLSPSGRSAGVHFLDLTREARHEIRQWVGINADTSSAEPTEHHQEPAAEPPQTETPASTAVASELTPAPPTVQTPAIAAVEMEEAKTENLPSPPAATPRIESLESSEVQEMPPAPEPTMESAELEALAPEPADALELLEATVDSSGFEDAPSTWSPATIPDAASALDGEGEPSSVLSLYGVDGEKIEIENRPEQFLEEADERRPVGAAAYPQSWSADRPLHHFRPAAESGAKARRARAHARRRKAAHKRPPILLSPIFVPAPPPSEFLSPPEPEKFYRPPVVPIETPPAEPMPPEPAQSSAAASLSPASLPESSAAPSDLQPGALYLPNYRIDAIAQVETPKTSWKGFFRKPKEFFRKPTPDVSGIFERFEEFGWSLETDWHVWVSLILLLAGFLSLAQKPPLIVLTIAFWFASAVVISDRRRPHGKRGHQKAGHR